MPELPEVETVVSELNKVLANKKIKAVKVLTPKTVDFFVAKFQGQLKNKTIKKVYRRAKMPIISLSGGLFVAGHLKMTGQFLYQSKNKKLTGGGHPEDAYTKNIPNKHTRVIFDLADGSNLYFNDIRKFGWLKLFTKKELENYLEKMHYGPEPLTKDFTLEYFIEKLINRNVPIKTLLLDQKLVVGIGNIYAAEILFRAKVKPTKKAKNITKAEAQKIYQSTIFILKQAIKYKGTTSDNFADIFGKSGNYIKKLKVYGRGDQKCFTCKNNLKKITQGQRSTVYCPVCQK